MTGTFKPYRHKGCIIYSPKNRAFLEQFAEAISTLPKSERLNMVGNKVAFGGIMYQIVIGDSKNPKIWLVSGGTGGTVFLAEE